MRRYALHDDRWDLIKDLLPGRVGHVGVTARDNRLFVDAVICRYRAGIPWRDPPERFGDRKTVDTRFGRWASSGVRTKIHALVDALGNPNRLLPGPGPSQGSAGREHAVPSDASRTLLADETFDADLRLIDSLQAAGKVCVISSRSNRQNPRFYDKDTYKTRHLIENFYSWLKQFRAIATRYEKNARISLPQSNSPPLSLGSIQDGSNFGCPT